MITGSRYYSALLVWQWVQWRLTPQQWLEAQQVLAGEQPTVPDPVVAAGFAEILNPATTNARRLELLQDLLRIIKLGPTDPGA